MRVQVKPEVSAIEGGGPPPPPVGLRDVARSTAREKQFDDLAAELAALDGEAAPANDGDGATDEGDAAAEPAKAKPKAKTAAKPPAPDEEPADEEQPETDEADDEEEDTEPDRPAAKKRPADRDLDARLAAIRKEQQRGLAKLTAERQAFQDELAALRPELEELRAFRQLKARAKYEPEAVLEHLGLGEDDWEPAAERIFTRSPKGRTDPRYRERVQRDSQVRQDRDQLSAATRRIEELENRIASGETETMVAEYLSTVVDAADDESPLVGRLITSDKKHAMKLLRAKARELTVAGDGEVPDAADVIAALEQDRRSELERLGIDVDVALKATPKPKTMPAAKTKPAKTPSNGQGTAKAAPARPTPRSRDEEREEGFADVVRALKSGKLDD